MTQRCSGPQCHSLRSHEAPWGGGGGGDWECTAQSYLEEQGGEREGAHLDILFKDVICAKPGEENMGARAWGGVNSFLHLCWQGEERDSWNHSIGP